jgi:putative MATE family efflux protein
LYSQVNDKQKMKKNIHRSFIRRNRRRRQCLFFGSLGTTIVLLLLTVNLTESGVRCFVTGSNNNNNSKKNKEVSSSTTTPWTTPAKQKHALRNDIPQLFHRNRHLSKIKNNNNNNNINDEIASPQYDEKNNTPAIFESTRTTTGAPDASLNFTGAPEMVDYQHIMVPPPPPVHATSSESSTAATTKQQDDRHQKKSEPLGHWPCGDKMDKELIQISLPVIGNYAISPLIGAVDLFWVNRMGNALAVAGQAASNQVFSSAFWFVSFLPSVTATLVSKQHAKGDQEGTQDAICQALFVGFFIALVGTPAMFFNPHKALSSVLPEGAPAMEYAVPYLLIRSFAFLPSLISLVGFSAFRGILNTKTPVKISAFANVFNALLDPILIFTLSLGVPGAAWATLAAEIISAIIYVSLLRKQNLISWRKIVKPPSWASLEPLLRGGLALQLRNLSLNLTFLAVARVTQSIDKTGVSAAAHAMAIQTFQIGGIVLLALSTVAQTVVPNAMVERYDKEAEENVGGLNYAKATVNRLMSWGFILGCALGSLQILLLPVIRKATPLQEVRDAAKIPAIIASVLQVINGLVFIGEG